MYDAPRHVQFIARFLPSTNLCAKPAVSLLIGVEVGMPANDDLVKANKACTINTKLSANVTR